MNYEKEESENTAAAVAATKRSCYCRTPQVAEQQPNPATD